MNPKLDAYERVKKVVEGLLFVSYGVWILKKGKYEAFMRDIVDACGVVLLKPLLDLEYVLFDIFQKKVNAEQIYMERIRDAITVSYKEIVRGVLGKAFNVFQRTPSGGVLQNQAEKEDFARAVVDAVFQHDVISVSHFENALWETVMRSQRKQSAQDRARYVAAALQKLILAEDEKDDYAK